MILILIDGSQMGCLRELLKTTDGQSPLQACYVGATGAYNFSSGLVSGCISPSPQISRPFTIPLFQFKQRRCLSTCALVENYAILQLCELQVIQGNAKRFSFVDMQI